MSTALVAARQKWPFRTFIGVLIVTHFMLHLGFGIAQPAPDLLVVAVLLAARRVSGPATAAGFGFLVGLLQDAVSLVAFGASALVFTLIGYLAARSRELFLGESMLFIWVYLFVGKWLHDALYFLVAGRALHAEPVHSLLVQAPLAALYAAAVGVAAAVLYHWLSGER